MQRYLYHSILSDLQKKMVFITGPRQVGKTFLAKDIQSLYKNPSYLNYDNIDDALMIQKRQWPLSSDVVIFDEIHKMKSWKKYLKGIFDSKSKQQHLLVTGSSRMETFSQTGESLAGRYFHYRLNPLSVAELKNTVTPQDALASLNVLGGFPEPFLSGSSDYANRWRRQYYTDLIREDILDFSRIQEIRSIRLLVELLRKQVGSPVSYSSLARDLQIAPNTVKKYIFILESLYIIFIIRPYHANIARSIIKEPKIYFYDSGYVEGDEGIRLENSIGMCLLKHVQYQQDIKGKDISLNYIRTKDKREVDFVIAEKGKALTLIESKLSDTKISSNLIYIKSIFKNCHALQLVFNTRTKKEVNGISLFPAADWLAALSA